jgi:hypothetical protein
VCRGLLNIDRCKISMEHNVSSRNYVICKEDQSTVNAIEDASIQQSLLDSKIRLSEERVKSFNMLTKQRARSVQRALLSKVVRGTCISNDSKVQKSTTFEMAFEKV